MSARGATPWLAYGCLAGSMAVVGGYVGLSKLLVAVFPVFLLAWLRFAIAAVAMAPWVHRSAGEPALSRPDRRLLFLESFFGNFLFSICMLFGVALTSAVAAGVILAALPAVVAVLSWVILRERITARVAAGIACAVGGIALVSLAKPAPAAAGTDTGAGETHALWGNLLLIGAVTCEATYVVLGKKLTGRVSPKRISALINLWGLALVTPFGAWQAWTYDFAAVPPGSWLLLTAYAVAASMLTVWLWMTGLKQVSASASGVFTVLLPISAALVGVTFLGERFTVAQAGAFGLALLGIVLATWPDKRATAAPAASAASGR